MKAEREINLYPPLAVKAGYGPAADLNTDERGSNDEKSHFVVKG